MMSKSKIRLRESRAIGDELGLRIVEGDNGLCMMFKDQCVHILHFLTKPGEPIVIEMSFPYTDRTEFVSALYEWCCDDRRCFAYRHDSAELCYDGYHFMLDFDALSESHYLAITFITNFKEKLKTKLEQEVIEVVDEKPMPFGIEDGVAVLSSGKTCSYTRWLHSSLKTEVVSVYEPKDGKLELIWSRDG